MINRKNLWLWRHNSMYQKILISCQKFLGALISKLLKFRVWINIFEENSSSHDRYEMLGKLNIRLAYDDGSTFVNRFFAIFSYCQAGNLMQKHVSKMINYINFFKGLHFSTFCFIDLRVCYYYLITDQQPYGDRFNRKILTKYWA